MIYQPYTCPAPGCDTCKVMDKINNQISDFLFFVQFKFLEDFEPKWVLVETRYL